MELYIAIITGLIGIGGLLWNLFGSSKNRENNTFREQEAERFFEKNCEIDENWSSKGRVYTRGVGLIEKDGKLKFIKQAKLCDTGILH